MSNEIQKNVFGEPLEPCSNDPLTGWFRDGCCNTDKNDRGVHTVCAKVTDKFLLWSKRVGNDLITPHPEKTLAIFLSISRLNEKDLLSPLDLNGYAVCIK